MQAHGQRGAAGRELIGSSPALTFAWIANTLLLLASFFWLLLLLHALQKKDEEEAQQLQASSVGSSDARDAVMDAFALSLVQSLLLIDVVKVLAVVFTSPQLLARFLPPRASLRNRLILSGLRKVHRVLEAIM